MPYLVHGREEALQHDLAPLGSEPPAGTAPMASEQQAGSEAGRDTEHSACFRERTLGVVLSCLSPASLAGWLSACLPALVVVVPEGLVDDEGGSHAQHLLPMVLLAGQVRILQGLQLRPGQGWGSRACW